MLRDSLDRALALDMQEHAARAYTNLSAALTRYRRFDAAEVAVRAGIEFCADRDLESWSSYMQGVLSFLLLDTGRWDQARQAALDVVTRYTGTVSRITPLMVLGRLETRTGAEGRRGTRPSRVAGLAGGRALGRGAAGTGLRGRAGRGGVDPRRSRRRPPPDRRRVAARRRTRDPVRARRAVLVAAPGRRDPGHATADRRTVRPHGGR